MTVVDSSVLVEYFIDGDKISEAAAAISEEPVAPHLIDAEVGNALRRLAARGAIDEDDAGQSLVDLAGLPLTRSPHRFLLGSAWAMRSQLSFYDALYAALAAELDTELVTADGRLARAARSLGVRTRAI